MSRRRGGGSSASGRQVLAHGPRWGRGAVRCGSGVVVGAAGVSPRPGPQVSGVWCGGTRWGSRAQWVAFQGGNPESFLTGTSSRVLPLPQRGTGLPLPRPFAVRVSSERCSTARSVRASREMRGDEGPTEARVLTASPKARPRWGPQKPASVAGCDVAPRGTDGEKQRTRKVEGAGAPR